MVDAEIELVEHPGGGRAREQFERLVDQVVVIEQRASLFFACVARDYFGGDGDQRAGAFARGQRALAREKFADTVLLGEQPLGPVGVGFGKLIGEDAGTRLAFGGTEYP